MGATMNAGGNRSASRIGDLSKISVLIVDDNRHMRSVVRTIMRGLGAGTILEAASAATAFEVVRHRMVDVVFCDWVMTPISGVEFVRRLRNDPASPNQFLPVVMMSAYADRVRIEGARDAGVTEFIVKPLTIASVLARMEQIVHRPRPFIRCESYFGPDRRRRADPSYLGPERRVVEGEIAEAEISPAAMAGLSPAAEQPVSDQSAEAEQEEDDTFFM